MRNTGGYAAGQNRQVSFLQLFRKMPESCFRLFRCEGLPGFVDVGIGLGFRIDDFQIGAGLSGNGNDIHLNPLMFQHFLYLPAGASAQQGGGTADAAHFQDDFADIDTFAAGVQT